MSAPFSHPFCTLVQSEHVPSFYRAHHDGIAVAWLARREDDNEWWLSANADCDLPPGFERWCQTFDTLNDACAFLGAAVPVAASSDAALVAGAHARGAEIADAFPLNQKDAA